MMSLPGHVFSLSRFQTVGGTNRNGINYLARIVAYVPQSESGPVNVGARTLNKRKRKLLCVAQTRGNTVGKMKGNAHMGAEHVRMLGSS